jgi:Putative MetA-pathway of phenol degradation
MIYPTTERRKTKYLMKAPHLNYGSCLLPLLLLCFSAVQIEAQLPFYTDDADTTERGKFHFEFFNEHDLLQHALLPAKRQNTANFTLDYGITKRLEFGMNAPLIAIFLSKASEEPIRFGPGDTQFGLKFRFRDERERSSLPAIGAAFYIEAPTGSKRKELGSGLTDYFLYGIVQKSLSKTTMLRLNGGIVFAGNTSTGLVGIESTRGRVYTANGSLVREFSPKLKLGAELFGAASGNLQHNRGQLETQFGGDYQMSDRFTLAFGVLAGRYTASPRIGALIGMTYDFK